MTAQIWKPTKAEAEHIRAVAKAKVSGLRKIEAGIRCNTVYGGVGHSFNIARVTKSPDDYTLDTDLFDFATWAEFRKGVELGENGNAIVDFYLHNQYELDTNIVVYYEAGRIQKILSVNGHNIMTHAGILSE